MQLSHIRLLGCILTLRIYCGVCPLTLIGLTVYQLVGQDDHFSF